MGGATTIYLTDEIKLILDQIRKDDPNINISELFAQTIINIQRKKINPMEIQLEIERKNALINQLRIEVQMLEEEKLKAETKIKMEIQEKEEEKIRIERKKDDFIKSYSENLRFYFDISEEEARKLADNQYELPKEDRKSVIQLGTSLGLVEKEVK